MNEHGLERDLGALPSGPAAKGINATVDALADVISQMPEGQAAESYPLAALWRQSGCFQINIWTHDLGRTLQGVVRALGSVKAGPPPPAGVDELEVALWRLDTGREKIKTIACLTLGVPVLKLVQDQPSGKRIREAGRGASILDEAFRLDLARKGVAEGLATALEAAGHRTRAAEVRRWHVQTE